MREPFSGRIEDDSEFRELRGRFLVEARARVEEMGALAAGPRPEGKEGARFRKLAHDLRGSGGSYGFPGITARAAEAEEAWLSGAGGAALRAAVGRIREAVAAAASLDGDAPSS